MRFFRIYYKQAGEHTYTCWFSGANPNAVFGKCGDLTFVNDEWETLRGLLKYAQVEFREDK